MNGGRRLALIVASSEYEDTRLRQLVAPLQDAQALARVLRDPTLGGFDVQESVNQASNLVRQRIEEFFRECSREDLLLLFFSGHGVKDEAGRLYFATCETRQDLLRSTAVEASFVNDVMQHSGSRRQVLILDCCYSGAFARGMVAKADTGVNTRDEFQGQGRLVITASDAMQYAYESDRAGSVTQSVFTRVLVEGIESGDADGNNDGLISFEELYQYVSRGVSRATSHQRPRRWAFDVDGDLYVSRSRLKPPTQTERTLIAEPSEDEFNTHCQHILKVLLGGRLVWYLGDGVNLAGRPTGVGWTPHDPDHLPTTAELAVHLARHFGLETVVDDLAKVSEDVDLVMGHDVLQQELRSILYDTGPPTPLHMSLARLPRMIRAKGGAPDASPVIFTIHYDDALERAFTAEGEPFDLLCWVRRTLSLGAFRHSTPDGQVQTIDIPNEYMGLSPGRRTLIVKLSGTFDRSDPDLDSFAFADYVDKGATFSLPVILLAHLRKRHHLFLGASVHDWHWRRFFHTFFGDQKIPYSSWTIQPDASLKDDRIGQRFGLDVLRFELDRYVAELAKRLRVSPDQGDAR